MPLLTEDVEDPVILQEVVGALQFVVGGPAGDDLLVVEGGGGEPDPALRHVPVRADDRVGVCRPHVERDDALAGVSLAAVPGDLGRREGAPGVALEAVLPPGHHRLVLSHDLHAQRGNWGEERQSAEDHGDFTSLTHDVQRDPGLGGEGHVVVGGETAIARPHVAPVQSLDGQRVLDGSLLVGDVGLVYDGVVPVPEHAGGRLPAHSNALDGQGVAFLEGAHWHRVGQLLATVTQYSRSGGGDWKYFNQKNNSIMKIFGKKTHGKQRAVENDK